MTTNVSNDSYIDSLKWQQPTGVPDANNNDQLTQSDFFALLTQQLSYQDPTKPADNDQMIDFWLTDVWESAACLYNCFSQVDVDRQLGLS